MFQKKSGILILTIAISVFACAIALFSLNNIPGAAAQVEDGRAIQTLLTEVHQLRIVLQRGNQNIYRAQIAVERMRLQQEQVLNTRRELEAVRTQLLNSKRFRPEMEDRIKELETQLSPEADPNRRQVLERQIREAKRGIDGQAQWEEALREKEVQLANQNQIEQGKLSDLTERIDSLERDLEKQSVDNEERRRQ